LGLWAPFLSLLFFYITRFVIVAFFVVIAIAAIAIAIAIICVFRSPFLLSPSETPGNSFHSQSPKTESLTDALLQTWPGPIWFHELWMLYLDTKLLNGSIKSSNPSFNFKTYFSHLMKQWGNRKEGGLLGYVCDAVRESTGSFMVRVGSALVGSQANPKMPG
jgi:hypothetical protein